jgi:hypothetical protein
MDWARQPAVSLHFQAAAPAEPLQAATPLRRPRAVEPVEQSSVLAQMGPLQVPPSAPQSPLVEMVQALLHLLHLLHLPDLSRLQTSTVRPGLRAAAEHRSTCLRLPLVPVARRPPKPVAPFRKRFLSSAHRLRRQRFVEALHRPAAPHPWACAW